MRNKQMYAISLSIVIALILAISFISGAVTIVTPGAGATITGTSAINVTGVQILNCTFYMKSASTANSSWTYVGYAISDTSANSTINATFPSASLEDSNDYVFNASCANDTLVQQATRTGLTIGNTNPTAPSTLTPTSSTSNSVSFSSAVVARTTTGCTLTFEGTNPGFASYTMTHSGSTCTYSGLNMPDQSYRWYVVASDGTNTATSSLQTTSVKTQKQIVATAILAETNIAGESVVGKWYQKEIIGLQIWVYGIIALLITIIYFVVKK
jgi:thiol:disulfide interchange protein